MFGCPLCFPKSENQNTLQVLKTMFLEPEKSLVRNEVRVELCGINRPFGIVRMVKAWRLRWFGYVVRMWKASNACRIFLD